jgi:Flp pilus assembly protein TadD
VPRPRHVAVVTLITAATVAVYAGVAHHGYVNLDDDVYVLHNPWIREGLRWETVRWAFTTAYEAYWIPLTWLSLALDCRLFGMNAGAHLVENVALHATNAALVYALLVGATGAVGRSAWVAGMFALHPLHVESVAWVSQRKDVLSTLFWLLATLAYVRYARRPSFARYLLVAVLFVLGLLAKPMLVTLPITLLLLDFWPLARFERQRGRVDRGLVRLVAEKLPLVALALATSAVTLWTQGGAGAVQGLGVRPVGDRIATALVNYGLYLGKLAWPTGLAVFYPLTPGDPALAASAALLLLVVSGVVASAWRREPALAVGWVWFLVTLLPVIGLVQVGGQQVADRYGYVPSIGLSIAVAWGAVRLWTDLTARADARPLAVAAVVTLVLAAVLTHRQVEYWQSSITLFERAVAVTERNFLAHNNLGEALASAGRRAEAATHYAEAVRIHPGYAPARNNHGIVLAEQGRYVEAEQEFRAALARDPSMTMAESNLATTRARLGDYADAVAHYERALALMPSNAVALEGLGDSLALMGRLDEAAARYREALRWAPGSVSARRSLARTLRRAGREAEAAEEERRAEDAGGLKNADAAH